uniref:Uncharacterized protein n=1 Tax=Zea mays TaxID=4577 RepID=B6SLM3_MAIZE|nr:hypothetical protein [Zea mays]
MAVSAWIPPCAHSSPHGCRRPQAWGLAELAQPFPISSPPPRWSAPSPHGAMDARSLLLLDVDRLGALSSLEVSNNVSVVVEQHVVDSVIFGQPGCTVVKPR